MRRILPLLAVTLGIATLLISNSANARHRRRCREQCCVCPEVPTTKIYCPKYKMMKMGHLYHYYALEYTNDCFGASVPVPYDSTSNLPFPCECGEEGSCCDSVVSYYCTARSHFRKIHKSHHVSRHISADSSIVGPGRYELEPGMTLDAHGEFIVKVRNTAIWLKVGRFTYQNGILEIPSLVGYQVDPPASGNPDVTVDLNALAGVDGHDFVCMLTIANEPPGPQGSERNGVYQVVFAD